MDAQAFERAVSSSRPVVASITLQQLDEPTPCKSWKVRDLINHMIDAPTFAAVVMETGDFSSSDGESVDHSSGEFLAAYDAATARAPRRRSKRRDRWRRSSSYPSARCLVLSSSTSLRAMRSFTVGILQRRQEETQI